MASHILLVSSSIQQLLQYRAKFVLGAAKEKWAYVKGF